MDRRIEIPADEIALPDAGTGNRRSMTIVGRVLSGISVLFLVLDAAMKLIPLQPVTDTMRAMGWPTDPALLRSLGVVMLVSTAFYARPRTALLGAILLTAYLGGAVASHVRIGSPLFTHVLFGVYVGLFVWGGLWLRSPGLRRLAGGELR